MKYVYLTLNWVFGIFFLLVGLISIAEPSLAGLCLVAISLFLLPPSRSFMYSKTGKTVSVRARGVTIVCLFVVFGFFASQEQEKEAQEIAAREAQERVEQAAMARQKVIDYFNDNRVEIIAKAKSALSGKDYHAVVSLVGEYLVSGDEELLEINRTAKEAIAEVQKSEKTESLLAKLKALPASKLEQNRDLYQQLSNLHPENKKYREKVAYYTGKVDDAKKAEVAAEARKKEIEKQFSAWDGSHNKLERLIKNAMNDPDSYEHDKTVYWDRGDHLIVQTTYRGKNAFGGVVRNFVKAKVSLDGEILQVIDQS